MVRCGRPSVRRLADVEIAGTVIFYIGMALAYAAAGFGVLGFVDAVTRRADAFVAADRQTKTMWTAITAAAAFFLVLAALRLVVGVFDLLWDAAVIAMLVYLADVRPRLRDVQSGSRW